MILSQTRSEFLTEALIEQLNDTWKVNAIESGHDTFPKAFVFTGRKYLSVKISNVQSENDSYENGIGGYIYMFVNRETGEVYKPASMTRPAKGVRYLITQLVDAPHICDVYGSFLYL